MAFYAFIRRLKAVENSSPRRIACMGYSMPMQPFVRKPPYYELIHDLTR